MTDALLHSWLRAFGLFRRTMEPYFAGFGITAAQWAVLHCLHRTAAEGGSELRMVDLGERLLVRPPSVTAVVQRSQSMGFLLVRRSAVDHRVKCIELTPAGRSLVQRILEGRDEQMRRVFGGLNEAEQTRLTELLNQLSMHLTDLAGASN